MYLVSRARRYTLCSRQFNLSHLRTYGVRARAVIVESYHFNFSP